MLNNPYVMTVKEKCQWQNHHYLKTKASHEATGIILVI